MKASSALNKYLAFALWTGSLALGFGKLYLYAAAPGAQLVVESQWPKTAEIARSASLPSLLLFVHPHCPCSNATVGELERLMPYLKGKAEIWVLFIKPKTHSLEWAMDGLWKKAGAIPGVRLLIDEEGKEASKFGALTSGHTELFDPAGAKVFQGGITQARGHMGDSAGRAAILSYFESGTNQGVRTPVFGCGLKSHHEDPVEGDSDET